MIEDIYLDSDKKKYYLNDFNENVLKEKDDFWCIDKRILKYLKSINSLKNIQSLYSEAPKIIGIKYESSLTIAYTKDVELKFFREVLPRLIVRHNNIEGDTCFYYQFFSPEHNVNYSEDTNFAIGCINNPEYFMVNHLVLTCQSYDYDKQIKFWEDLFVSINDYCQ